MNAGTAFAVAMGDGALDRIGADLQLLATTLLRNEAMQATPGGVATGIMCAVMRLLAEGKCEALVAVLDAIHEIDAGDVDGTRAAGEPGDE